MSITSGWEWTDVSTDRDNTFNPISGALTQSRFDWKLTRTQTSDINPFVTAAGTSQTSGGISASNAGGTTTYTPPIYEWNDGAGTYYTYNLFCQDDTVSYQRGGIPWYTRTQLWSYSTGWIPASKL